MKRFIVLVATLALVLICTVLQPPAAKAASESDLTFELNGDGLSYYVSDCVESAGGELVIPATHNGKLVTGIGDHAFSGCTSLTSITIPDSVTSIGKNAFYNCTGLTDVYITDPSAWCKIDFASYDANPMYHANQLHILDENGEETTEVVLDDSVTRIGALSFYNCTSMTSITIPGSVTDIDVQAFWGCTGLTSITIPAGVISIGDYAFTDCTGLTSITIPDSVTTIGDDAFYGCPVKTLIIADGSQTITSTMVVCKDTLEEVFIPDSVTSIRNYAFENCTNLTSVTIGNGITTIGVYAFKDCTGLTSIVIPNSVTSIGEGTLSGCSSLTSITIPFVGSNKKTAEDAYQYPLGIIFGRSSYPGSVATEQYYYGANLSSPLCDTFYIPTALKSVTVTGGDILFGAFDSCAGLTNIVLPDEAASIGDYAFYGCTSLTGIILPDGITSIGEYAFYGCNRLTSVSMPDSVTSIDEGAFYGCTALTSITIPSNVRNIGDEAFKNCTSLLSVTLYDHYDYFATSAFDGCQVEKLIIADGSITVDSKMVICKGTLKEIVIPDSVGNIKEAAFSGCGSLESITIPFVGRYSHTSSYYAENLFGYIFGAIPYSGGVATQEHGNPPLNSQVYYIPAGLKSVTVIRGDIAYEAFNNCCGLTNITLLDHVKSIGDYAFSNCTGLTSIAIPKDVTVISDFAFARCTNLTSVVLPDSITNIGAYAFSACSSLVDIALPNGVKSIGAYAFSACSSLVDIALPDGVKSIGAYAFSACSSLVEITIPNGITSISRNAFDSCTSLTNVILPAGLTEIGDNAFFDCTHLTSITIPDSAVNIGNFAFYHCADMTHITLGNHIVSIGDYAFSDCTSLASVTYCGTQAQWDAIRVGYYNGCLTDASLQLHSGLNGVCTVCGCEIAYTITFQNWDGTVLSSQTYHWGDVVIAPENPTKAADNTYRYTFAGWDNPVVNCAGDATYKATYNATYIDYKVVFKDADGTVLSSQTYHWGDVVTAPSNPTKAADNTYTYTFAGWDKPVVNCAGDVTYTATYKAAYIDYVVKFLNEDGTVISAKTYHWGDVVTAPSNPTKAADHTYTYAFAGWDKTVVNCAGNATYKATYNATYINYTVVFKNWDGTVLSSKTYHYGDAVSAPGAPTRPKDDKYAYTFVGWDKAVVNCAGDATYTAVYSAVSLVPNTITSSTHTVRDGIISKITVGTITDQLINALNEKSYAKVFSGTTEVPGSALVGTGMEVRIMDGDTVTVSATAVVTGDINGDGKITVTDFVQMKAHLLKKSTLQGVSAHAADTNGDGNISVTDFVQMKAHLLGKNPVQPQSVPAATPVSVALSVSQNDASEQEPVAAVSYTHIVAIVPDKKTLITV